MADIRNIIAQAAQRYGVNPNAMNAIAYLESGLDPAARNPRSSAGGLFQQIDANAADYGVENRFDPAQSAEGAAKFARDNANVLRRVLGREPTTGELYLAHQQGPGGATRLLRDPNARAVDVVGAEAVRLNGGDENMTAGEFANLWINKAQQAEAQLAGGEGAAPAVAPPAVTPQVAQNIYQAFTAGRMSPEQEAEYRADVEAGRMILPEGATLTQAAPAVQPVTQDPAVVENVYTAYVNGMMSADQAQQYAADVASGAMPLPMGVAGLAAPMTPSPDTDTAPSVPQGQTAGELDLTRQYAGEAGGDLARQSFERLRSGESGGIGGTVRDVGLTALGGLGAVGGAAAGLVGDVAEAAGVPRAPQLARDLAAIPEALAGSPMAVPSQAARVARAAPDASPVAPPAAQATPSTSAGITPEIPAPRQLTPQETNEMRSIIARAANNNQAARRQLAEMAQVNPEAAAAAERLGISAPVDVFADNPAVQQAAGIVRAVRGSDAGAEWEETFTAAQQRANELLRADGAPTDISAVSARVQDDLTKSINTLRSDAGVIYNEIRDQIPTGARLQPDASTRALNEILDELGGPESLGGPVRSLFNAVTSDQGMTYGRLMQERQQIGRAITRGQGPYADADERTLSRLYGALAEDQQNFVRTELGENAVGRLAEANGLWSSAKDLEERMISGFGRDQEGSIANTLRTAITNAARGDAGRLNRVLNVVPKDLQREALVTGISDLAQARSGQGGFSFAQYAKTYRGLRENSEIYGRIAPILGEGTTDLMRDLYEVSIRMDRAAQNVPRTGASNQALIADGLINGVLNSAVGRAGRGMAAGVAGSAVGGPMLGSLAAVGASSGNVGKGRAEAVGRLFRDPAFKDLAAEVVRTGTASKRTINAVNRKPAFRRWARVNNIQNPDAWIAETIARAAAVAPSESETEQ